MSSIDAAIVQQVFGGDDALFESLTTRLLREYADLTVPTLDSTGKVGGRAELERRLHRLKGSAGMIGASTVARLAGAAETALQKDRPPEELLAKLATALTVLGDEVRILFEGRTDPPQQRDDRVDTTANVSSIEIEDLYELLQNQDLAALCKCSDLAPGLIVRLGKVEFERLRVCIDQLDFLRASQLLLGVRGVSANNSYVA